MKLLWKWYKNDKKPRTKYIWWMGLIFCQLYDFLIATVTLNHYCAKSALAYMLWQVERRQKEREK